MNYKQAARTGVLAALIVSPTIVLLAMQMPFWLPEKRAALTQLIFAGFDPFPDFQGPAFGSMAVEGDILGI